MINFNTQLQIALVAALVSCVGLGLLYFESKSMAGSASNLRYALCRTDEHCTNLAFQWPDAVEVDYPKGVKPPADLAHRYAALRADAPTNLRPYLPPKLVVGQSFGGGSTHG